jgi:hypothetical protein
MSQYRYPLVQVHVGKNLVILNGALENLFRLEIKIAAGVNERTWDSIGDLLFFVCEVVGCRF